MFFDKILDMLNMDNWNRTRNDDIDNSSNDNPTAERHYQTQQHTPLSIEERALLLSIKKYWRLHPFDYRTRPYREESFSELKEYAKIDILSCFTNARAIDNFSDYLLAQLGITNWNKFFSRLLEENYVRRANTLEILNSHTYTVAELKILADSLGIPKYGRKRELAQRISASLSPEESQNIANSNERFILTEKGIEHLRDNEDYVLFRKHKEYCISLAEFNDYRMIGAQKRNFYDTMFQCLSGRAFYNQCVNNYGSLAIDNLHIFELMIDEFKHTDHNVHLDVALFHYVKYLYLMSCFPFDAQVGTDGIFAHELGGYCLPHIHEEVYKLYNYKESINFDAVFAGNPPSFFTQEEFIQCVFDIFESPMFNPQRWNNILQNRLYNYSKI